MMSRRKKSFVALLLKLLLVVLLLQFLAKKGLLSLSELRTAMDFPAFLSIALVFSTASFLLSVLRWRMLLQGQDITLSWAKSLQLSLIGGFFNLALPGAVSGDLVKAFYISREHHGKRGHAFGSILFDRIVGVSGLILTSSIALLAGYSTLQKDHVLEAVQWFVLLSGAGVLAFFLYLFFFPERHDPVRGILQWMQNRVQAVGSVARIYEGVRNYHRRRWMVVKALAISCIIHVFAASSCLLFTLALSPSSASTPPIGIYALAPIGLLATAVPLAPAGVGTGHAAFSWLFLLLGLKIGANVFSLFVLYQIFWSMVGGVVYLRYRAEIPHSALSTDSS